MNWFLLNSGPCEAAFNMALDEALLEKVSRLGQPVLRFYGWTEPAATFGYFQKFAEVARTTQLRPLIRRPTGGGIVPHAADWTYSAGFPPGHEWHSLKAEESYRRIHDWLRLAFAELKVATELAPQQKKSLPGQCFVGHEKFDLLWQGKKIAGAAQRRNQLGLLIQGSVQPPPLSLDRADFEKAMTRVAEEHFQVTWAALPSEDGARIPKEISRIEPLNRRKAPCFQDAGSVSPSPGGEGRGEGGLPSNSNLTSGLMGWAGSVHPPVPRAAFDSAAQFSSVFSRAHELVLQKYSLANYNQKR